MSTLPERVHEALQGIIVPKLQRDLFAAGMVEKVEVQDGQVKVLLNLKPAYASKSELRNWITQKVRDLEGVREVSIDFVQSKNPTAQPQSQVRPGKMKIELEGVDEVVTIFSAKGGVGKSTVSANLAATLAQKGARVGLFDADVHGPDIPNLLGLDEPPRYEGGRIQPISKYGLVIMSIGLIVGPDDALIWRGPMITKAIDELLEGVAWGSLDYLLIDLPPGTGDAQLGLAQDVRLTGSIAITTPQELALADLRRGIRAFRDLKVPIWGLVENMSYFVCPHCGERSPIFGAGGGALEAKKQKIPLLGQIPLDLALSEASARGEPVVHRAPDSPASKAFTQIAEMLLEMKDMKP